MTDDEDQTRLADELRGALSGRGYLITRPGPSLFFTWPGDKETPATMLAHGREVSIASSSLARHVRLKRVGKQVRYSLQDGNERALRDGEGKTELGFVASIELATKLCMLFLDGREIAEIDVERTLC